MRIVQHHASLKLIFIFLACLLYHPAYPQESETCAEKLRAAQTLFERGQVEQVPSMISECLRSGFNREESLQAYKLIIQSYLFNEQLQLADSTMLAFLGKNPEYQVSPTDHTSFVSLFNDFYSKVIIQFSAHLGTNMPFISTISSKPVMGVPGEKTFSSSAYNFFISAETKYKLTNRVEINAEVGYSQLTFMNSEQLTSGSDIPAFGESKFEETQVRIEIPVTATYDIIRFGRFTPYARLGFGPAFNIHSQSIGELPTSDLNNQSKRTGGNEKNPRIFMDVFIQAGGGIKFKVRNGFFFTEFRSNFGLLGQSEFQGYNTEDDNKHFFFMAGEDDFRMNTMNFNAGYTWILYKPVRKEK